MQTFLPFADFDLSAQALDNKRLGKQRVETLQIMQSLFEHRLITKVGEDILAPNEWYVEPILTRGWANHPAKLMWQGYEWALLQYQQAVVYEWVSCRGYGDTCLAKTTALYFKFLAEGYDEVPSWLGDEAFHLSHRSNLVKKDPDRYGFMWPDVPDNLPYIWPV